jgi:hypothetical protein
MKRRSFMLGLTSLLVAPAVVRAGSLMPIQVLDRIDPQFVGPVDLEFISNEFARLLTTFGVKSQLDGQSLGARTRMNIQFLSSSELSKKDFSAQILRQAAANFAREIPKGMRVLTRPKQLILPPELERFSAGVAYAKDGPGVRAGRSYSIAYDQLFTQLDVVLVK